MLQIASAADASSPPNPKALQFACALARQCFVNEHVFATTDDEAAAARQLRESVIAALASGAAIPELWLAVIATYYPLNTLPGAVALLNQTSSRRSRATSPSSYASRPRKPICAPRSRL